MLYKKYKLFSAISRCAPCRSLTRQLDIVFPEWKQYIEYVDVDGKMTKEQIDLAIKLGVMGLPSFTSDNEKIFQGFKPSLAEEIKKLCLTKE